MPPSLPDLSALIRHRRSIKPVDMDPGRDIDRALITELIENATWAPNHGLTEPWKFHVFQAEARQGLVQIMQETYRATTAPAEFREDKFKKMGENPLLAPVVIACVMERSSGGKQFSACPATSPSRARRVAPAADRFRLPVRTASLAQLIATSRSPG